MKKLFSVMLMFLVFWSLSSIGFCQEESEIKLQIEQAVKVLLGESASPGGIVGALGQLLDCSAALAEGSQYNDEIKHHLRVAKEEFSNKSIFSDKGRQYLALVYRMMTEGRKYQPPAELDEFVTPKEGREKARQYGRKLVESALADLSEGKLEPAALALVELVLLIVTPMSGSNG